MVSHQHKINQTKYQRQLLQHPHRQYRQFRHNNHLEMGGIIRRKHKINKQMRKQIRKQLEMQICRKIRVQNNKNNDKKKNVNKCTKNQTYLINNNTHYEHKTIVSIEEHQNKNKIITNGSTIKKIKGKAIFNKTLVEYLYDSGSDTTLITEELFKQIQLEDKNTKLMKYNGKPLKSFTDEVKIIGELILNNCSFNQSDNLKNIRIIVTKNQIKSC